MSRPHIDTGQITDSVTAQVLREHRQDRDALLERLTASLQVDSRVRAAWLWGSLGRSDADDLSDLDPWVIVADDVVKDMGLVCVAIPGKPAA